MSNNEDKVRVLLNYKEPEPGFNQLPRRGPQSDVYALGSFDVKDITKVDFAAVEARAIASLEIDPEQVERNWLGTILPGVQKADITIFKSPLKGTGRVELYALVPESRWSPGFWNEFADHQGEAKCFAESANLPDEIARMPFSQERVKAVRDWYKRLYSACYAEVFCQYPNLYYKVMLEVCRHRSIRAYPVLWSGDFTKMIETGTLGNIEIDGLIEMGYLTVPEEWLPE